MRFPKLAAVSIGAFLVVVAAFSFAPSVSLAALDKVTAQGQLDDFRTNCKVGSASGSGSECLRLAQSLVSNLKCGGKSTSGDKALFEGANGKITKLVPGGIDDCQSSVNRLPGDDDLQTATKTEDAAQKACKEYDEQRTTDNKGDSVYSACKEGYKAGYKGTQSRSEFCNQFTGKKRESCTAAYKEGDSARPGGNGNDPMGLGDDISYSDLPQATANDNKLDIVANIAFGIAGSLAMLFVAVGGVRYIMSQGDSQKVAQSKNTILYAVAGLVVTISAFAIVKFVLSRVV
jgi:Type IV secretion system pilin